MRICYRACSIPGDPCCHHDPVFGHPASAEGEWKAFDAGFYPEISHPTMSRANPPQGSLTVTGTL